MKVSNTDEVRASIAAIDKKFMEDVNWGTRRRGRRLTLTTRSSCRSTIRQSRENRQLRSTWPK